MAQPGSKESQQARAGTDGSGPATRPATRTEQGPSARQIGQRVRSLVDAILASSVDPRKPATNLFIVDRPAVRDDRLDYSMLAFARGFSEGPLVASYQYTSQDPQRVDLRTYRLGFGPTTPEGDYENFICATFNRSGEFVNLGGRQKWWV